MKFSRRELYILVVTLVIGVGWLGNGYVLQPYLAERKDLALKNKEADRVLRRANATIAQRKDSARMWKDMLGNGLQADVSTAQSQMVHSVGDWAQSAGLNISSVSPERADQDKQFRCRPTSLAGHRVKEHGPPSQQFIPVAFPTPNPTQLSAAKSGAG